MPKQTAHIRKYSHNKEFSENEYLKDSANIDWAIIATFYSALHFLSALSFPPLQVLLSALPVLQVSQSWVSP